MVVLLVFEILDLYLERVCDKPEGLQKGLYIVISFKIGFFNKIPNVASCLVKPKCGLLLI